MIDAQSYAEYVDAAGHRIARDAEGNLELPVPSCPEMTVAQLVAHTAEFCGWSGGIVHGGAGPGATDDPLESHTAQHAFLVESLRTADPDGEAWTWSVGADRKRFWFRRAAQELAVHAWDIGNAVGKALAIDATLAADGIDEMLTVFGAPNTEGFPTIPQVMDQGDRVIRLETTDTKDVWTFKQAGDLFDFDATDPEVTARGTASDLLLFLWGRTSQDALDIEGNPELLALWQERVKI